MIDPIAQLCQLIVDKLRDEPEVSQAELLEYLEGVIITNSELEAALKKNLRMRQDNQDGAKGFQFTVEDDGRVFIEGTHYHFSEPQKILAVLRGLKLSKSEMIDFRPYLQSLASTYKDWQKYYTFTDAIGKTETPEAANPSLFDFGLEVQTVTEKKESTFPESGDPSPESRESTERLPVMEGIRKYAKDHVLLIGRPGSGKSTALVRLLHEMATQAVEQQTDLVPILIELRYWQTDLLNRIQAFINQHDPDLNLDDANLTNLLLQGQFCLLIDGLNELPSEEARSHLATFRRDYPKVPMIFTTRDLVIGGDLGIEKKLEMQAMTETQMQAFIRAYMPEQADALLQQLNNRLREFGKTPLLLWMLCKVFQDSPGHQLPFNLAGVFKAFTTRYEVSSVRQHEVALLKGDVRPLSDRRLWKKALVVLASVMMKGKTPVDFRVVIHRGEAERELNKIFPNEKFPVRDILDDLLKYHLLQNHGVDKIEFRHQLIQEYYAAEHLLQLLLENELSDDQLKLDYLNYLKWTEPIALMLSLVDSESLALRVVKIALDVDLRLGAIFTGKAPSHFQTKTVEEIITLPVKEWIKVDLLGETKSEVAIPKLLPFLEHPSIELAKVAASYIGETNDQAAINVLTGRLEEISTKFFSQKSWGGPDKTGTQWTAHIQALGHLAPREATRYLREKLEKHSTLLHLTTRAAPMLMEWDANNIIPEKLEEFQQAQLEEQNKTAVSGEDATDNFQTVKVPLSIMQNEDSANPTGLCPVIFKRSSSTRSTRNNILNLLETSSDYELFIPALIQLFEQEMDEKIKKQIIQILGKSKNDAAIHLLIQILGKDSNQLSADATKQLIKLKSINNPNDVTELKKLIEHENWTISWRASVVLGHFKDSIALPRMMYELANNQLPKFRVSAIKILGIIGDSKCIPSLLSAIENDENQLVRLNAACELSHFGCHEAIPVLLDALESPNQILIYLDLYTDIVRSIARFGIKEPLLKIVRSESRYWQTAAIEIGKLAKSQKDDELVILPNLFRVLIDPGHESSNETIKLLSELANIETTNSLIDSLEHPERYTKDIYFPNRVVLTLVKCKPKIIAKKLPYLKKIYQQNYLPQLSWLIPTIQNQCKFYNYEIWHTAIQVHDDLSLGENTKQASTAALLAKIDQTTRQIDQRTEQMANEPKNNFTNATFNAPVNFGDNPTGNFIGTQNHYASDPEMQNAIFELQSLLTQLQSQHPQVETEAEAMPIIDAEFTELKRSQTNKFAILRKQIFTFERHAQAMKATLGEVAKHYLEENVWAKAVITYLDKMSETPDQGA